MEESKELSDLNDEQKKDLLKVLLRKALEDKNNHVIDNQKKADLLKNLKELYEKRNNFKAGDLIKWKSQLKNRKLPDYNEPIIILEVLSTPIFDTKEPIGSTYFNEKFDIKVGILRDDSMLTFFFESNRFEYFE